MIKPTVGRVVWFYRSDYREGQQPRAALIAHVWSDTCVNLAAFDEDGSPLSQTFVLLIQDDAPVPSGGYYCTWMPYQMGQAQKAAV